LQIQLYLFFPFPAAKIANCVKDTVIN